MIGNVKSYFRNTFYLFVTVFLGYNQHGRVGLWFPGAPESSTGSVSGLKASQKTGLRLKVSSDRLGEAGNRSYDLWLTRHRLIPFTKLAS